MTPTPDQKTGETAPLTLAVLDKLLALERLATSAPWTLADYADSRRSVTYDAFGDAMLVREGEAGDDRLKSTKQVDGERDAEFIGELRNWFLPLVEAARRGLTAEAEIKAIEANLAGGAGRKYPAMVSLHTALKSLRSELNENCYQRLVAAVDKNPANRLRLIEISQMPPWDKIRALAAFFAAEAPEVENRIIRDALASSDAAIQEKGMDLLRDQADRQVTHHAFAERLNLVSAGEGF